MEGSQGKKRKRADAPASSQKKEKRSNLNSKNFVDKQSSKSAKASGNKPEEHDRFVTMSWPLKCQADVEKMEEAIMKSVKYYNGIVRLLNCLQETTDSKLLVACAVILCRIFCRLISEGKLRLHDTDTGPDIAVKGWIRLRFKDLQKELLKMISDGEHDHKGVAFLCFMRCLEYDGLEKHEGKNDHNKDYFPYHLMDRLAEAVLYLDFSDDSMLRDELINRYLEQYVDVSYAFFKSALKLLQSDDYPVESSPTILRANVLYILLNTKNLPGLGSYMSSAGEFLVAKQPQEHPPKSEILELKIHKRQLESVWLAVLGQKSNQQQMNQILQSMTNKIMPTFVRPVLLMDFLTDAYNIGGTPSVVALNGLFELMNRYNLDYPEFYTKLYGLFNRQLLHSRYRSRFFRLVGVFLNSTHLPAALIASFIKRMSRLCVSAPAPGIAIVIPFIYNLLKRHPTCTFMVHREKWDKDEARENGVSDPFDNECEDPWATNALESSLWEIQMLQSHVMPNVATLARVISEQFTKNSYNMEDFMDHTATTMIDGELEKSLKGGAYVEPVVRKKIFSEEERRKVLPLVKQGERLKRRVKESSYESTPPPIRQESESDWEEDPPDDLVCIWGF